MKNSIRIIVVGDEKVGKTTLINSFLKEQYETNLPECLPEISIPPDITVDKIQTFIIDTPGDFKTDSKWLKELKKADVICLVYSVLEIQTFEQLSSYWLPYLRSQTSQTPVILVGNKIDQKQKEISIMSGDLIPLMNQYKEIESCIECSAKEILNVAEVFYFASKSVIHPTGPLFDFQEHQLKPKAVEALKRIFKLSDKNKDGLLDDEELNQFQKKVFGSPLQQQELEGVKEVVSQNLPDGLQNHYLNESGFLYLHSLFIQRGRLETIWSVLRQFNYNDQVDLDIPLPSITEQDFATELSPKGYQFLIDLFRTFDQDKDGALNQQELNHLFATSPGNPFLNQNIESLWFLALWSMMTLLDYKKTLLYLGYLGYEGALLDSIKVLKNFKFGTKKRYMRSVFHALVFGNRGCGKSEFLKGLIERPFEPGYQPNRTLKCVSSVEMKGNEKYLVLEEVDPDNARFVLENKKQLQKCDLLIFLYDLSDPNSFSYIVNLYQKYQLDPYPLLIIGTKKDLQHVTQMNVSMTPEQFTQHLKIGMPLEVSMLPGQSSFDIYHLLLGLMMHPQLAMPAERRMSQQLHRWLWLGLGLSSAALVGLYYWRLTRQQSAK